MEPFILGALLLLLIVGAVIGLSSGRRNKEQSRRAALAAKAGMRYSSRENFAYDSRWRGGPFGAVGENRYATDVIYGVQDGWPVVTFDFTWTVNMAKNDITNIRTVTGIYLGGTLPYMEVAREVGGTRERGDLETESTKFNDMFRVRFDDRGAAINVLHPRMMEFLMDNADVKSSFWIENGWMFTSATTVGDEFEKAASSGFDYLTGIAGHIPSFVKSDYGITGQSSPEEQPSVEVLLLAMFPSMFAELNPGEIGSPLLRRRKPR